MWGVVITADEDAWDLKVFENYSDACERFNVFKNYVGKGGYRSISLYDVPDATGVREAAAAIENHDAGRALLLRLEKAGNKWVQW